MKTFKRHLAIIPIALLLVSCDPRKTKDQETCDLYNSDQIDAVEALERLGLQPRENGKRFEPVEKACSLPKRSS